MRDHETSAVRHEVLQRFLDQSLRRRVHARRRFIENQDRRIFQKRPRDREPLLFAHAQLHAALTHHAVEPLRQQVDEPARIGRFRRGKNVRVAGVGSSHQQILADRAVEQKAFLRHDPDHFPQPAHPKVADPLFIDQDFARVVFVESRQQIHQGRFAGAGRAHERDRLARLRMKCNVLERRRAFLCVTETDVVELHVARYADRRLFRFPARLDRFVDDLEDALARRASRLHQLIELMQPVDRLVQKSRQHQEREKIAQLHGAA